MPFTLRNEEFEQQFLFLGKMKNLTTISPIGNEEFNENFLFKRKWI